MDCVLIPYFNKKFNYLWVYKLPKHFKIIGSAHNLKEIRKKSKQGCNEIFLSPIFKINKSKNFLGIIKFNLIKLNCKTKLIALGGINQQNFKRLKSVKLKGLASIRWAKKNGLRLLRSF